MMMITRGQIQAAAAVLTALRPDWDPAGIITALHRAQDRDDAAGVILAAVLAATDPANRTPAVIALHGPHWAAVERARHRTPTAGAGRGPRCREYGHEHHPALNCPACRSERLTGMRD